jgi:hypothetical protein
MLPFTVGRGEQPVKVRRILLKDDRDLPKIFMLRSPLA